MSICIIGMYLLHPFGNQITEIIHRGSHIFFDMTGLPTGHHHHHVTHFALDGNHFIESADELSKGHSHPIINFLSAAFDFEESMPDSQKKIHLTLDLHLISLSDKIPIPFANDRNDPIDFESRKFSSGYNSILTPPPRTAGFIG